MINIDPILKKYNAFFAFSNDQFKDQYSKELAPYISIGAGAYIPKINYKAFKNEYELAKKTHIENEKRTKKVKKILFDAFLNYELQFSDLDDLNFRGFIEEYNFSEELIEKEYSNYLKYCAKHDLY